MDIKIVKADLTEVEQIEREYNSPIGIDGGTPGEIDSIAVKQVLDLRDGEYNEEVKTLVEWAKENGATDPMDIKWAVRDLRMRIGTPTFGDSTQHLARFAYLDMEEKRIKAEKETFK